LGVKPLPKEEAMEMGVSYLADFIVISMVRARVRVIVRVRVRVRVSFRARVGFRFISNLLYHL
jgi:hypothetical protein